MRFISGISDLQQMYGVVEPHAKTMIVQRAMASLLTSPTPNLAFFSPECGAGRTRHVEITGHILLFAFRAQRY